MKEYQSLSHTRWDCKYPVVFIPKRRKKRIFGELRRYLGEIFHELAKHKGWKIVEGHLFLDHVHMCLSIPPKHGVANIVGSLAFGVGMVLAGGCASAGWTPEPSANRPRI